MPVRWRRAELTSLVTTENEGRKEDDHTGLDPTTELPFHRLLAESVASSDESAATSLIDVTRSLVAVIRAHIIIVRFWDNATKQDEMRKTVKRQLDDSQLFDYGTLDKLATDVVDVAKANHRRLT